MGRKTPGITPEINGTWSVDKIWRGRRLRQRGFVSHEEAQGWLIAQLQALRAEVLHGAPRAFTFSEAAARYLIDHQDKVSLETEVYMLNSVMPFIGGLDVRAVHDDTLRGYVAHRLKHGRKHKTINLALAVVRRILNLAATSWRDDRGQPLLASAPLITLLPLVGHQRAPRPITWPEQRRLMPLLPDHLARMALFMLNTGARDDVVCSLRWAWEIPVPELGVSVFEVPARHVKGRRQARVLVCNAVAQSVIEAARGQHPEFVFVYRRERRTRHDLPPKMPYRPVEAMLNTAWVSARKKAGLGDLHVHDLRHTVGMRLREAGVGPQTISDVLWHSTTSTTAHYSLAQLVELHSALTKIEQPASGWNKTLLTLRQEAEQARLRDVSHPKVTHPTQRIA